MFRNVARLTDLSCCLRPSAVTYLHRLWDEACSPDFASLAIAVEGRTQGLPTPFAVEQPYWKGQQEEGVFESVSAIAPIGEALVQET